MQAKSTQSIKRLRGRPRKSETTTLVNGESAPGSSAVPLIKIKNILVPVDFSEGALKALRYAVSFAKHFGASISLLHVVARPSVPVELETRLPSQTADELREQARGELFALVDEEVGDSVSVNVHVRTGNPVDQIVDASRDLKSDLVIIAPHAYSGLSHFVLGSTAEKVIRKALCPVLIIRQTARERT